MRWNYFLKRKNIKGGIDNINSSKISGWVYSDSFKVKLIRLYAGKKLLYETKLTISREDINQKFISTGIHGFEIKLYYDYYCKSNEKVQIKALLEDGFEYKLKYISNKNKTNKYLSYCLSGTHLGMIGNIDSHNLGDNYLRGWAYKKTKNNFADSIIWIQCEDMDPILVKCNKSRPDLNMKSLSDNCGFIVNLNLLPKYWQGKKIKITFDMDGRFLIYSNNNKFDLTLEKTTANSSLSNYLEEIHNPYIDDIKNSPEDLKNLWKETDNFRKYLENIESKIDFIESKKLLKNRKIKDRKFLNKFLKSFN